MLEVSQLGPSPMSGQLNFLLYPLVTMIHRLSQSSYDPPPTMYPQIVILLHSLMERHRV